MRSDMNSCSNKGSNNRSHESNKTSHKDNKSDKDDKTSHKDNYDDSYESDGNAKVFIIEPVTPDVNNNITHHSAGKDSDTTGRTEVASSSVQETGITVTEEAQDSVQGHSKHFIGYDRKWETEFTWLEVVTDDKGKAVGMLCTLRRKQKTENKYNHSKVWSKVPCIYMHKYSICCHLKSEMHSSAIRDHSSGS